MNELSRYRREIREASRKVLFHVRIGWPLPSCEPGDSETDKRGTPMKELTHFIGGKRVRGTSGRFGEGSEPMTGEVISRVPLASKAEVRAAVENAIAAQPTWAEIDKFVEHYNHRRY